MTTTTMSIVKYRPSGSLMSPFNAFVNSFFGEDISQILGSDEVRRQMPGVNIVERDSEFDLQLLAPGFSKEDLKLGVEDDVLTISAEKETKELAENERYTRREFTHSSFRRSFRLPEGVDLERIQARHVDGVLHVSIPKAEPAKPRTKAIDIG